MSEWKKVDVLLSDVTLLGLLFTWLFDIFLPSLFFFISISTHIQVTDSSGQYMARTSCGTEGFRNVKKSTPIAAQTAGISVASVSCNLFILVYNNQRTSHIIYE